MSEARYWPSASVLTITELEGGVEAGLECGGEPLVPGQAHEVIHAMPPRNLNGAIGRAVVDDEPLHPLEAGDLPRELREHLREGFLLVQAGDLDDQLHGADRTACPIGGTAKRPFGAGAWWTDNALGLAQRAAY
jgi:hypothetical protein